MAIKRKPSPSRITAIPKIMALSPNLNTVNAPVGSAIDIIFSEAMNAATASNAAIKVSGSLTGKRSGNFSGSGTSTATFTPNKSFKPGELISVTTTTAATNAGGTAMDTARVYSFRAAAAVGPTNFIANPTAVTGSFPHTVYPADYDGDGDIDVAISNAGAAFLTYRKNNGDGTFAASTNLDLPSPGEAVFAADFNEDGNIDLATANTLSSTMSVLLNNGFGVFPLRVDYAVSTAPSTPYGLTGGDFDGDGDIDLATTAKAKSVVVIFTNDGNGVFTSSLVVAGTSPQAIATADFDKDGDLDLAITNIAPFQVAIKLNNGVGSFSSGTTVSVADNAQSIYLADFDGDGDIDLVTGNANSAGTSVSVRFNNGKGVFSGTTEVPTGKKPQGVHAADIDGDGDMDILTANFVDKTISIRLNDGSGAFSGTTDVASAGNQTWAVNAADFDGDSDLDLIALNESSNRFTILLNKLPAGANASPTISAIANQSVCINTSSPAIAFTVGDAETAAASLTVTASSDNTTLVPVASIVAGGSGANRTVTITPATGQTGMATITLTVTDGNAASTNITFTFTVNSLPTVVAGSTQAVCANAAAFTLAGFSPVGGTWSGSGVSAAGVFTPSAGLVGAQTLTYTVTQSGCTNSATKTVTVDALPTVIAGSAQAVCANAAAFTLSGFSPAGGTWSGSGVSAAGVFTPSVSLAGAQTLTYSVTQSGCTNTATKTVTVNTLPTVDAGSSQAVCSNAAAFTLTGFSPAGGTWSGNGVSAAGVFTPSAGLVGAQTLTYTVTQSGCTNSATKTVTVDALPTVVAGSAQAVCANAAAFTLTGFSPAGGTWSGSGVDAAGVFTPAVNLVGAQTLTYSFTQSGCTNTATKTVTVNAIPTVSAGSAESICATAAAFTLTSFSPAGGTWSGNGVDAAGVFTPSTGLIGAQTLTYTFTQSGCTNSATKTVTVEAAPSPNAGPDEPVCANAAAFTLAGFSPAGGTWAGNGVSAAGLFTPTVSLLGAQLLTYTVNLGGCTNSATKTVTVNAIPTVDAGAMQAVCANAAAFTLTGFSPAGGTWSGNGVDAAGVFTPAATLVGDQTLTYSFTQNGCTSTSTKTVTVNALPIVDAGATQSVCADAAAFTLAGFSPAGGTWSGSGVDAAGLFTPSTTLIGDQLLTYTVTQSGCTTSATKTVTVNSTPVVMAGGDESICASAAAFTLAGFSPTGGTWSGNGVDAAGVFTPSNTLVGAQLLTYTITTGGCTTTATKTVTVDAAPIVNAGENESICEDAKAITLTGFSPAGGTWSGNGVDATGIFTPNASLVGVQTLTYSVIQSGCTTTATKTMTVTALPVVDAGDGAAQKACASGAAFALTGFSPAGGTWSGSGVDAAGMFTPAVSLIGKQVLTYTVTQNGCTATDTINIQVASDLVVTANKVDNTDCLAPNGSITLTITGGLNAYTILWGDNTSALTLSNKGAGTYSVTVTDAGGCSVSQSFTLADPNGPTAFTVSGGGSFCQGGTGFNVGLSGSENNINYQLLHDGTAVGTAMAGTGSALDFGLQTTAGTYTINAKNAGGCSSVMTGSAAIVVDALPDLTITPPPAVCAQATINLTTLTIADANNTTGTLSYWTDANATQAITDPTAIGTSGTYFIKKATAGGCSDIESVIITINSTLTASAGADQGICATLPAFTLIGFSPAGGSWSGNGVDAAGVFTPTASLIGAQILTYTVTQGSCTATATKTVTVTDAPVAPTPGANTPAAGESLNLTASNIANATYQWTGPASFTSSEQNPTIANVLMSQAGVYSVTATVNGCTSPAGVVDATVTPPVVVPSVTFAPDSVAGNSGTQVVVNIRVKDFKNILAAQGSVQWDATVATFVGIENFGLASVTAANFGTTQAGSGKLAFSWSDPGLQAQTLADDAAFFAIRFNLIGSTGTSSLISMSDSPVEMEVITAGNQPIATTLKTGKVTVIAIVKVAGSIKSVAGTPIRGVSLQVTGGSLAQSFTTAADGLFQFDVVGANIMVAPFKNNDVVSANGITTLDLILVQRHILAIAPLTSPYKMIAADVNHSGTITTFDILLIRSLILQNTTSFPNNRLWAFVRSNYTFPNPANPFPYDSTRTYTSGGVFAGQDFVGVKLGDVNDTWDANVARIGAEGEVGFQLSDQQTLPGQEITVPVKVSDFTDVSGYQFTLNWNPQVLELVAVQHGNLQANYGYGKVKEGKLTTTWQDSQGHSRTLPNDSTAFNLRFKVVGELGTESALRINSSLTASEAYNNQLAPLTVVNTERNIYVGERVETPSVTGQAEYALLPAQPNPFSDNTAIRFSIPRSEEVQLLIYNNMGQVVKSFTEYFTAGEHKIRWNGETDAGATISTGSYFVQMRAGTFVKGQKLVMVR